MITATMKTINSTPDQTPALKIPPIASQLLKLKSVKKTRKLFIKYLLINFIFK